VPSREGGGRGKKLFVSNEKQRGARLGRESAEWVNEFPTARQTI
jgi:hypothetical protein